MREMSTEEKQMSTRVDLITVKEELLWMRWRVWGGVGVGGQSDRQIVSKTK